MAHAAPQRTARALRRLAEQERQRGLKLMALGQYAPAAAALKESLDHIEHTPTRLTLAQCYELAGQLAAAEKIYNGILNRPQRLNRATKAAAERGLAGLKERIEAAARSAQPAEPKIVVVEKVVPAAVDASGRQLVQRVGPRVTATQRILSAQRASGMPTIDGKLDEGVWREAVTVTEFVQRSPNNGAAPDQKSEYYLLYEPGGIYVGVRMFDAQPALIRKGLGPRDNLPDSDHVTVYLDPLQTKERGYFFQITASGIVADGLLFNQTQRDTSWDGVWQAEVQIDDRGWTAEYYIPLTSIGFQKLPIQKWGIYIERYVQRTQQTSGWPAMPPVDGNTFVSKFGELSDLYQLRRKHAVHLQPYSAIELMPSRGTTDIRRDLPFRPNAGIDAQYSTQGEFKIALSVNADFGQVEQDAAVISLTPDATYVDEKRPFFVAGSDLFQTPVPGFYQGVLAGRTPLQLLYTRRIAQAPSAPAPEKGGQIVELDTEPRLIGAAKAFGQSGRFSYGALSAAVMPTYATEEIQAAGGGGVIREDRLASPWSQYSAARAKYRLGSTTNLGGLVTVVNRFAEKNDTDAYSGSVDWDWRSPGGWEFSGLGSISYATSRLTLGSSGALSRGEQLTHNVGYSAFARFGQRGFPWQYWIELESVSPRYDINDAGFLWRNNMLQGRFYLTRFLERPRWIFLSAKATLFGLYGMAHDDPSISFERMVQLDAWGLFRNLWSASVLAKVFFPRRDDRETRGGSAFDRPLHAQTWVTVTSNTSKMIWLSATAIGAFEEDRLSHHYIGSANLSAWNRLNVSLSGQIRWVKLPFFLTQFPSQDTALGTIDMFGDTSFREFQLRLASSIGITRILTLQLLSQMLLSRAEQQRYLELRPTSDDGTALIEVAQPFNGDFTGLNFTHSVIFKWDMGSGSAAYVVYKFNGELQQFGDTAGAFNLGNRISDLFGQKQTHLVLFKISYGWDF